MLVPSAPINMIFNQAPPIQPIMRFPLSLSPKHSPVLSATLGVKDHPIPLL